MNQSSSPSKALNLSSLSLLSLVILAGVALVLITHFPPALAALSSPLSKPYSSSMGNPKQAAASLHPALQPIPVPPAAPAAANPAPKIVYTPTPLGAHPAPLPQPVPTPPAAY